MSENTLLSDRYEVRRLIGRGGMAEVHEGLDTRLGRRVAIKLLRSDLARDPSFHTRLEREAQSAARLNHPGIVSVYDSGEQTFTEAAGGTVTVPFIVMEYIDGQTLRQVLTDHGRLTVTEALDVAAGVLAPLAYSHRQGIVHRDIKPANVMLTPEGDIKVMDFGIARALEDTGSLTQTQSVIGTAQYLSPEQARGEVVDSRSDLYSTACLLYELLTGRPPFVGDSQLAVAYQHVGETPQAPSTLNPEIPHSVDRVVLHALTKNREERYQDAHTFREDLIAARDGRPLSLDAGDPDATQLFDAAPTVAGAAVGAGAGALGAGALASGPPTQATALQQGPHTTSHEILPDSDEEAEAERDRKRKMWMWVGAAVLAVVLAGLGLWVYTMNREPEVVTFALVDVSGQDANEAETHLESQGLVVDRREVADDKVEAGKVVETDPAAGTQVSEGQRVTMAVSTGPDSIDVPDVSGDTESLARQKLAEAGLTAGSNIDENSPDVPEGEVIETKPGAGTSVPAGSTVDLVLSTGRVEVPDVIGLAESDACAAIEADDVKLTCEVKTEETADHDPGTVFEQSTDGGETIEQGGTVTITVAEEPAPTPTPEPSATVPDGGIADPPTLPADPADPGNPGNQDDEGNGPGFGNLSGSGGLADH